MRAIARLAVVVVLGAAPVARAQNFLLTRAQGRIEVVQQVRGVTPMAMVDGRVREVNGQGFILRRAPFFRDGFIKIEGFSMVIVTQESAEMGDMSDSIVLSGTFTASQDLRNCFLAFEMVDEQHKPTNLCAVELPDLAANEAVPIRVTLGTGSKPAANRFFVHVFSGRFECKQTRYPGLGGKTLSDDLAATASRPPAVLMGVPPAYPAVLKVQKVGGSAIVRCRIGPEGDVVDATAVAADRPEFGAAAVDAARQWLFVPPVKEHQYAEATVEIPFSFQPPKSK